MSLSSSVSLSSSAPSPAGGNLARPQSSKWSTVYGAQPTDAALDLERLVRSYPVMLFMKGTPFHPRCGFSRKIVDLLHSRCVDFQYFNVLDDHAVREGLKAYSRWPTFPQLFVRGELVGGVDVLRESIDELFPLVQNFRPRKIRLVFEGSNSVVDVDPQVVDQVAQLRSLMPVVEYIRETCQQQTGGAASAFVLCKKDLASAKGELVPLDPAAPAALDSLCCFHVRVYPHDSRPAWLQTLLAVKKDVFVSLVAAMALLSAALD